MKKIIFYLKLLCIIVIGASTVMTTFTGCKEIDSTYKDLVVPGGIIYPEKAVSPIVYSGRNRVKISWLRGSDPSVIKARIFWNNYTDSVEVDIPADEDTISCLLEDFPENTYSFYIRTYDSNGNVSIPVEVIGTSYGEQYENSLLNRVVDECINTGTVITVNWGFVDTTSVYATEVRYTNTSDEIQTQYILATEDISTISDMKEGTIFQYRTIYVPNHASIDTFYTDFLEIKEFFLDKSDWSVIDFSSQHSTAAANVVTNIIDGDPGTRWHTHASTSQYPHYVTIDMKKEWVITGFEIFRMTDDDRACDTFQLLVSTDNETWVDLGVFDFNRLINDGQYYEISSQPPGRYFKFVGLTGPHNYMVLGEINVYGK